MLASNPRAGARHRNDRVHNREELGSMANVTVYTNIG